MIADNFVNLSGAIPWGKVREIVRNFEKCQKMLTFNLMLRNHVLIFTEIIKLVCSCDRSLWFILF